MKFSFLTPLRSRGGVLFILAIGFFFSSLSAQFKFREPPNRQDPAALSPAAGERVWEWFHLNRQIGHFSLNGALVYRPAGAPSSTYRFQLDGDWREPCQITRVTIHEGDALLVSRELKVCGSDVMVSDSDAPHSSTCITLEELDKPVIEELPFTWLDVLMPYLEWDVSSYLGPDRFLGRPAHQFELSNPDDEGFPARVVVTIDEDYAALLQCRLYDDSGFPARRMSVGGFKRFDGEWMFSELNWEFRRQRSSVRLEVYSFAITN